MYIYEKLQNQFKKYGNVQNLMPCLTENTLKQKHNCMKRNKAVGVDNVTKTKYEINLDENIHNLVCSLKDKTYFFKPALRHYISKPNGGTRALGIPSYEDKIVQGVMADILISIYELIFYDCSFGYRPNRNCHHALKHLKDTILKNNTSYILEADISGFFDNVNHQILIEMLQQVIKDKVFILYVKRMLKAGIVDKGHFSKTLKGTPQGALISPVLANVYLHYCLDSWFLYEIKTRFPYCELIRYCDDFIICCSKYNEAQDIYKMLQHRFTEFKLQLNTDKTRIINLSSNENSTNEFKFLGFSISAIDNQIHFQTYLGKTVQKQQHITSLITKYLDKPLDILVTIVNTYLVALYQYYSVASNMDWVYDIYYFTLYELHKLLCSNEWTHYELNSKLSEFPIASPPSRPIFNI